MYHTDHSPENECQEEGGGERAGCAVLLKQRAESLELAAAAIGGPGQKALLLRLLMHP